MKRNKIIIFKYFIEFLIVGFGVFLGIYVSEWKSKIKTNEKRDKSVKFIYDELESNRNKLLKTIEYHELIKVGLDSLIEKLTIEEKLETYFENNKFNHNQIPGWTGIGLPDFEDVGFEGAKLSGIIQDYDFELVQEMSKIYKEQNFISEMGKSLLNNMISLNSSSKNIDVISIFETLTSDFINAEKRLYKKYQKSLNTQNETQQLDKK